MRCKTTTDSLQLKFKRTTKDHKDTQPHKKDTNQPQRDSTKIWKNKDTKKQRSVDSNYAKDSLSRLCYFTCILFKAAFSHHDFDQIIKIIFFLFGPCTRWAPETPAPPVNTTPPLCCVVAVCSVSWYFSVKHKEMCLIGFITDVVSDWYTQYLKY